MAFVSPTYGEMSYEEVFADIVQLVTAYPDDNYSLIIGTDSQLRNNTTCFVTAIIVHRHGKGGRFYYTREKERFTKSLRQRIFYEASLSLAMASQLTDTLGESNLQCNVEIHLDVGTNGATRDLVKEVVGMVVGSGYEARIKPDSYGASSVADKYTK